MTFHTPLKVSVNATNFRLKQKIYSNFSKMASLSSILSDNKKQNILDTTHREYKIISHKKGLTVKYFVNQEHEILHKLEFYSSTK